MLRNYIAVALRNLTRNPLNSAISLVGLAVGLCAAALAGVTLRNELTYEHFIPGYGRTYLAVGVAVPTGHAPLYAPTSPSFVAALLKLNLPQIRAVTRIVSADVRLRNEQMEAKETLYWADPNAFELLPLPVVAGDLAQALRRPDGIVLTRSVAEKYFGRDDPLGRTILLDDVHPMTVTAVLDDLPSNGTTLESGIFASGLAEYSALSKCDREAAEQAARGAVMLCGRTYIQLAPQTDLDALQKTIDSFVPRAYPKFPGMTMTVRLIRIDRVNLFDGLNPGAQSRLVVTGAVALIILFASCVVFVNLTTARSARRALEVGVRKACGATRADLILQFLGDSVIHVALATCLGLALSALLLPTVNAFLNSGGHLDFGHDPALIAGILVGVVAVGVLAGAYPAFVLSAFRPSTVLKGSVLRSGGAFGRQALVVLQFAILIGLIVAATVIYRQCVYVTRDALRVNTDEVLLIHATCKPALLNELRSLPAVRGAYCSSEALLNRDAFSNVQLRDGTPLAVDETSLDFGALGLYGIKPVAGRLPTQMVEGISSDVVINETAARRLGFTSPNAAIGQLLPLTDPKQLADLEIVAVVPDFAFDVGMQRIRPTLYVGTPENQYPLINVKLTGQEIPQTLAAIDRIGAATGAEVPLDRIFLSQYIQNLYLSVLREAQALAVFAAVAVVLACLGLLGLAAAAAERRTKEIGIRKALGAGTADILRMLLWQFSTPIIWANLLAWPVSALLLKRWLEGFAAHVNLSPLTFVAAGALTLVIALATVTGHALVIARAKPVMALRYE